MALPTIAAPPANPIDIDAAAPYHYVIASYGEDSLGFSANPNFALSLSGRTLSVRFTGTPPTTATTYEIEISATNSDGVTRQTVSFRVASGKGAQISSAQPIITYFANGTVDLAFDGSVYTTPIYPLAVDDVVISPLTNTKCYVVAVDTGAGTFQLSTTQGGSPFALSTQTGFFWVCFANDATTNVWVGDTSGLSVDDPIQVDSPWVIAPDASLRGTLYVLSVVDDFHITVSLSMGGSAIGPTSIAYSYNRNIDVFESSTGTRQYADITSGASDSVAQGASVSYTITSDVVADSYGATGLPSGLTLTGAVISGTAPAVNLTSPVVLTATISGKVYKRYWLLIIGTGSAISGDTGGGGLSATPTTSIRLFFDGDFTVAQLAGPPVFEIPFKADPKPYAYKLPYWQFLADYREIPLGSAGPLGGFYVGGTPGTFKAIGGGVIEFWREYALVPDNRNEFESFVYGYQIIVIGEEGGITELPTTVQSRLQFDYFKTDDPEGTIVLPKAPRAFQLLNVIYGLNGLWGIYFSATGTEVLAEDATYKQWKGNIYERQQRFIRWISPTDFFANFR